jgi:septal ring-binding cell division protein DamX/type II secretory pathway predicted ATPase ExeA
MNSFSIQQANTKPVFKNEQLDQQLDLLQHLLQFGDELLILSGVAGIGKSTLLSRLERRMAEGERIEKLHGHACIEVSALFDGLAKIFYFDYAKLAPGRLIKEFQRHLQELDRPQRPVVVIEDAHLLSTESLETLVHLSVLKADAGPLLRIVLCGRPELQQRLSQPPLGDLTSPRVITLQPFDEEQSQAFVHFYQLNRRGLTMALTSRQLKGITSQSGGIPLQLEEMLEQQKENKGNSSLMASWQFWVGIVALIGFLLLVFWPSSETESESSEQSLLQPLAEVQKPTADRPVGNSLPTRAPLQTPEIREVDLASKYEDPELDSEVDSNREQASAMEAEPGIETVSPQLPSNSSILSPLVSPVPPPKPLVQPVKAIIPSQEPQRSATKKQPSGEIRGENWLLKQPATHFTLQLFASSSSKGLKDMAERSRLTGDLAQFNMWQQGRSLNVLVKGSYANRKQAEQAVAELPSSVKPWIRSMGSIHQILKQQRSDGSQKSAPANLPATKQKALSPTPKKPKAWQMPVINDSAWLWGQDPTMSTIQLIAAGERAALNDFVAQNRLTGDIAILELKRRGAPWFVLLMGNYKNKVDAKAAIAKLPKSLRNSSPWARGFASIHDELSRI